MGDPAGIGLDIAVAAWHARHSQNLPPFVLYAEADAVRARALSLGLATPLAHLTEPREGAAAFRTALPIVPLQPSPGRVGASAIEAIERATADVAAGDALALVTNPITKAKPGFDRLPYPGHTEFLADLAQRYCGGARPTPVMMLACDALRVVPATVHIPLARVPSVLTAALLAATIRITHAALQRDFAIAGPRLAVAGLNPHAGEDGLIGTEEITVIAPAVRALLEEGFAIEGPLSADTLFHAEARTRYDAVIAMYHDQALIPIKTIAFDTGVNVTLGLPFVRTSPDHGTAFALAGTGKARPHSFIAALRMAHAMAHARNRHAAPAGAP